MKTIKLSIFLFFFCVLCYSQENQIFMDHRNANDSSVSKISKLAQNRTFSSTEVKSFDLSKSKSKSTTSNTFGYALIAATGYNFNFQLFNGWYWTSTDQYSSFYDIEQEYNNHATYGAYFELYVYRTPITALSAATIDMTVANSYNSTIYQNMTVTTFANQTAYWNSYSYVYSYVSGTLNISVDTWSFTYLGVTYKYEIFTTVSDWNTNNSMYNIMKGGFYLTSNSPSAIVEISGGDFSVKVFPNPSKDVINFESSKEIKSVSILNLAGQSINQSMINSLNGQISVKRYKSGYYLIEFETIYGDKIVAKQLIE